MICLSCKRSFKGEMTWPKDLFPNGPNMCCSGIDCYCLGLPIDLPWFTCPHCGHRFELSFGAALND